MSLSLGLSLSLILCLCRVPEILIARSQQYGRVSLALVTPKHDIAQFVHNVRHGLQVAVRGRQGTLGPREADGNDEGQEDEPENHQVRNVRHAHEHALGIVDLQRRAEEPVHHGLEDQEHDVGDRLQRLHDRVVGGGGLRASRRGQAAPDGFVAQQDDLEFGAVQANGQDGLDDDAEDEDSEHVRFGHVVWVVRRDGLGEEFQEHRLCHVGRLSCSVGGGIDRRRRDEVPASIWKVVVADVDDDPHPDSERAQHNRDGEKDSEDARRDRVRGFLSWNGSRRCGWKRSHVSRHHRPAFSSYKATNLGRGHERGQWV